MPQENNAAQEQRMLAAEAQLATKLGNRKFHIIHYLFIIHYQTTQAIVNYQTHKEIEIKR